MRASFDVVRRCIVQQINLRYSGSVSEEHALYLPDIQTVMAKISKKDDHENNFKPFTAETQRHREKTFNS